MKGWTVETVMGLAALSSQGRALAELTLKARFVHFLEKITDEPETFRAAMRRYRVILSGGAAVRFLETKGDWTPGDFDFFCSDEGFEPFCDFVQSRLTGSTVLSVEKQAYYTPDPNSYVAMFSRGVGPDSSRGLKERRVITTNRGKFDILRAASFSPLFPIVYFHSTIVMSVLSADAFCIPYPWLFLKKSLVTLSSNPCGRDRTAVEKYVEERGYDAYETMHSFWTPLAGSECMPHGHCARDVRYFADEHCLTFSWDHKTGNGCVGGALAAAGFPFRCNICWVWGGSGCNGDLCTGEVDTTAQPFLSTPSDMIVSS